METAIPVALVVDFRALQAASRECRARDSNGACAGCGMAVAGGDRDIDLYHWSTPRFSSVWQDTLSVLVARGRARVSVSASAADWPKRIRDMQYVDHDDFAVAH